MTVATPEWRALTGSARRPLRAVVDDDASPVRALLAAAAHQPLLLADLAGASTNPAEIAAPVFGREGVVALALSLTTLTDESCPSGRVRQLAAPLVDGRRRADDDGRRRPPLTGAGAGTRRDAGITFRAGGGRA